MVRQDQNDALLKPKNNQEGETNKGATSAECTGRRTDKTKQSDRTPSPSPQAKTTSLDAQSTIEK